jgi:hypothetical protein
VQTLRGTLRISDGHRRVAAADSVGIPILAWVSWLTDHPDPRRDEAGRVIPMKVALTYELATGRSANMPTQRNPKHPPFTVEEVEEIRGDVQDCVSKVADRRKLSARYDEIAPSESVIPMKVKLTRRGAQQADLFGNPRGRSAQRQRPLVAGEHKGHKIFLEDHGHQTWEDGQTRQSWWVFVNGPETNWESGPYESAGEATAVARSEINDAIGGYQSSSNPDLDFDGPQARARYEQITRGKVRPKAAVRDDKTGAYMALLPDAEIFHIDRDGFVYTIDYGDAAEAKDDWDYLRTKFPKLSNPRRNPSKFPPLPRGSKFTKHGHFDLATVPVETRISYQGSQETVTYKPVKAKRDADTLVVYWKNGSVAGIVDAEAGHDGKYTARSIWEGERLRPLGRQYNSLSEALASLGTWRNPDDDDEPPPKRKPRRGTEQICGYIDGSTLYDDNDQETPWMVSEWGVGPKKGIILVTMSGADVTGIMRGFRTGTRFCGVEERSMKDARAMLEGTYGTKTPKSRGRKKNVAWMNEGRLYHMANAPDENSWFVAQSQLKNGGWKGVLIRDYGRNRKPIKTSLTKYDFEIWREVPAWELPPKMHERLVDAGVDMAPLPPSSNPCGCQHAPRRNARRRR